MISILNKLIRAGCLLALVILAYPVAAQESLSLSVTPPLFQLSAVPGQAWQSTIRVINSNPFPITVYANPVNFAPVGEGGQGRFIPVFEEETQGQTLAEWISVQREPIVIDPEKTFEIPFSVNVPADGAPGGHFAAILVGTQPPDLGDAALAVRTSQVVSSLFFLRVAGDVVEKGSVREFSVEDTFVPTPEAKFFLRFQNDGNVHIRPQGEIKIYNMWGKERGVIPINHGSHFGNVLPDTIRKFEFSWKGERALSDIGRYTAEVTLGYGENGRQNVSQKVSFWVIPVKLTLISLAVLVSLVLLIRWAITSYIRRMLRMAGIDPDDDIENISRSQRPSKKYDLAISNATTNGGVFSTAWSFVSAYRLFFVGIPSILLLLVLLFWYMSEALVTERNFEATIGQGESEISINSEALKHQAKSEEQHTVESSVATEHQQPFSIRVINVSGEPGAAADIALTLEQEGYVVDEVSTELDRVQNNTVVITDEASLDIAQSLSALLDNALVSFAATSSESLPSITIYVGKDSIEN